MRKRCHKCGDDQEVVKNAQRVLRHALPQLKSPVEIEVPFTCANCGSEVSSTIRYLSTGFRQ